MEKHQINFKTASFHQHGWLYQYRPISSGDAIRRLVLVHGAGVAGELSWTFVANYLASWDEVLILDLAGMGGAEFLHPPAQPQVHDYSLQLLELVEALDWLEFDLAGYSFGGMVAVEFLQNHFSLVSGNDFSGLLFLLEPAMLFSSQVEHLEQKADEYASIADALLKRPNDLDVYRQFLDSVSPNRKSNPQAEQLTMQRLQDKPQSFSSVLYAVEAYLKQHMSTFVDWRSPWAGVSFFGGLAPEPMKQRHKKLAADSVQWDCLELPGADHSLVFTKPRGIARKMNEVKLAAIAQSALQSPL